MQGFQSVPKAVAESLLPVSRRQALGIKSSGPAAVFIAAERDTTFGELSASEKLASEAKHVPSHCLPPRELHTQPTGQAVEGSLVLHNPPGLGNICLQTFSSHPLHMFSVKGLSRRNCNE